MPGPLLVPAVIAVAFLVLPLAGLVIRAPWGRLGSALTALGLAHGYDTAFWWTAGILAGGAIVVGLLFRPGPLYRKDDPAPDASVLAETEAGPALPA